MAQMKLVFLDCRKKLVTQVVERLAGYAEGDHPVDFSAVQVVLPTAEAGRIIREELAQRCDSRGGAVNLSITMPEHLLQTGACASDAAVLSSWLTALRGAANGDFPTLLRNDVLDKFRSSPETLLGWADSFQRCRRELALEDLDLEAAVGKLDELCRSDAAEVTQERCERFQQFRKLETVYLEVLRKLCPLPDPAQALKAAVGRGEPPPGIRKIILIDCLDLKNGPAHWLKRVSEKGVEVEFWIDAPPDDRFDEFGRPDPALAEELVVNLDLDRQVRCVPRPDQQAQKLLELLKAGGALPAAVAVPDPEVAESLELRADLEAGNAPDRHGVPRFFVPREFPLDRMPWTRIFLAVAALAEDKSVAAAARLWEEPFFADYAGKKLGIGNFSGVLKLLDKLREESFAADTDFLEKLAEKETHSKYPETARTAAGLAALCRSLGEMRAKLLAGDDLALAAFEITGAIGGAKRLEQLTLRRSEAEIDALEKLVAEVAQLKLPAADGLPLLRKLAAGIAVKLREKPWEDAIDVVGFLEIGYTRDDTVLMAGCNEEVLSNGAAVDPLLPEKLRETLGMTTRKKRFAADALRFAALAASRRLCILYGRKSQAGETLRPSRLLFLCGKEELPKRVSALFGEALVEEPPERPAPARKFEAPGYDPAGFAMSITGFKSYLECPFTFALQKIRGVESRDPEAVEMDDLRYGTFFHSVLETLMRNYLGKSADEVRRIGPEELMISAMRALRRCEADYFGGENRLPGLAKLQCGIVAEALKYVAVVQGAEFADAWRPVALECKIDVDWGELYEKIFPGEEKQPWRSGIRLKGKIDRIDLREREDGSQVLRVLDYKTSAKAEPPRETHTVSRVPEDEADLRVIPGLSGTKRGFWKDLQLPLYVLATRHVLIEEMGLDGSKIAAVRAWYFELPPEMTNIGISMFEELEYVGVPESAARCADGILRRIFVEKRFWPPKVKHYQLFEECELDIRDFEPHDEKEVR